MNHEDRGHDDEEVQSQEIRGFGIDIKDLFPNLPTSKQLKTKLKVTI